MFMSKYSFVSLLFKSSIVKFVNRYKFMKKNVSKVADGKMEESLFYKLAIIEFLSGFLRDGLAVFAVCFILDLPAWSVAIYALVRIILFVGNIVYMFVDEVSRK